jgi:hypothetical protein
MKIGAFAEPAFQWLNCFSIIDVGLAAVSDILSAFPRTNFSTSKLNRALF